MNKGIKYITVCLLAGSILSSTAFGAFEWAEEGVKFCVENKIMQGMGNGDLALDSNLTREQMAKMLVETFKIEKKDAAADILKNAETGDWSYDRELVTTPLFEDVAPERWSYDYINTFSQLLIKKDKKFNPAENVTRQEFAAYLVLASGLTTANIRNRDILDANFDDADKVEEDYKKLLCIAVERGYMKGADGLLRADDLLNRAEVCTFLHRVVQSQKGEITLDLGVRYSDTPLVAPAEISVEQAKQWAKDKGAHQRFIDIADLYWKYGELSGLRPEILYAQAAKETNFGKYTGAVLPEQNNWAGIKTATSNGDSTYDHETFATPEDGVRGHFNHMSAYVGLKPIGEPHGRYNSVSKIAWAGTITNLEGLGGKWCPDLYYGYSILHNFIEPMLATEVSTEE